MQIREIRLLDINIFKNEKKVFSGNVEDAYDEYGNYETKKIHFEDGKMCINI